MLAKLLYGYKVTQCLYVAAKLNIADHLAAGKKSIDELSKLTNTKPDPLYRVMRCLAVLGIFQEEGNKMFSLNQAADDLRSNSENTMRDFVILCGEELYQSAGELLYSVQTGKPAFDHIYGMSHWEYLEANPEKASIFHDAMEKGTGPMLREIISHYDFSPYERIVDVGGGKGQLICEILRQYPAIYGAVYDLPNAKEPALDYINTTEIADRCTVLTGNFFDHVPDADLHILKVVLHDWNDQHAKLILRNSRKAMPHNGKLLIIEKIVEEGQFKDLACLGDINMLVTLTGKERSLAEFQDLLNKSGFNFIRKINTSTVFSILEAEPKW